MPSSYLIDAVRTPIGSFGGSLSAVRADDLAVHAIRPLLATSRSDHPNRVNNVLGFPYIFRGD